MNSRILLVEPSATLRYVFQTYFAKTGYQSDNFADYSSAQQALEGTYNHPDDAYKCVVLGWPESAQEHSEQFISLLETESYRKTPVIVLAQDMRADVRAWVAGRSNTVLVRWKDYRSVLSLLKRLVKRSDEVANGITEEAQQEVFPSKFSNSDIGILVVDDSSAARVTLNELLKLQGYRVHTVASMEAAIDSARAGQYDIAVIDYYLQEATGDELVRQFMGEAETRDMTCAILTGTYSDSLIKRALRAGAVECMFKNESSELLLARIDALSRLIRGKKQLREEHGRLEAVLGAVKDGVYCVDRNGTINFANARMKQLLKYSSDEPLTGRLARELLHYADVNGNPVSASMCQLQRAYEQGAAAQDVEGIFFNRAGEPVKVVYSIKPLMLSGEMVGSVVEFSGPKASEVVDRTTWQQLSHDSVTGLLNLRFFETTLQNAINRAERNGASCSLVTLKVEFSGYGGHSISLSRSPALLKTVSQLITRRFTNTEMMGYLGDGHFGLILSQHAVEDAYGFTRRLIRSIVSVSSGFRNARITCNAGMISVGGKSGFGPEELISKTRLGCQIAARRGENYAFVCDINHVVPCFTMVNKSTSGGGEATDTAYEQVALPH